MKRNFFIALVAACLLAGASRAAAHAFLDHALPAVGGKLKESPVEVKLWFTEKLEPAFSSAQVFDETGKQVDLGVKPVDEASPALMEVSLPKLKPGTYKVVWRVISVDTHKTNGQFTFQVSM